MAGFATMPLRRSGDIKVVELEGETLIYDLSNHKSHCLNGTASLVWRFCDGTTWVEDVVALLRDDLSGYPGEEVVRLALQQFAKANLLQDQHVVLESGQTLTRRDLLRRVAGVGVAAAALPVVASLVAPGAAEAASPTPLPTETATPVPQSTSTPSSTATPMPTSTPITTPTSMPTSTPDSTPTPAPTSTRATTPTAPPA